VTLQLVKIILAWHYGRNLPLDMIIHQLWLWNHV
jgi:hypothetical protein